MLLHMENQTIEKPVENIPAGETQTAKQSFWEVVRFAVRKMRGEVCVAIMIIYVVPMGEVVGNALGIFSVINAIRR